MTIAAQNSPKISEATATKDYEEDSGDKRLSIK